jgi:DNA polymerase lambda
MNNDLINNFKILIEFYKNTKDLWRERSYQKAVNSIKHLPKKIKNIEDVSNIKNIGNGIKNKIKEFIETKHITLVEEIKEKQDGNQNSFIKLFENIWGVGPVKAKKLYNKGYRSLNDILENDLTEQQKIGLKYYEDLLKRIERKTITLFKNKILKSLHKVFDTNSFILEIAGSYRRKKQSSGDVDIIISPLSCKNPLTLKKIVDILQKSNLISDILSMKDEKFMGIAKTTQSKTPLFFRLDIEFLPKDEFSTGLLYFTGSKEFNIEIRQHAKNNGMLLNQHGLFKNNKKITITNELQIFQHLNLQYLEPENR